MRSSPTRGRYAQILLTYTRPWPMRIWAAGVVAYFAWLFGVQRAPSHVQFGLLMLGGFLGAFAAMLIASHVKEQIADARSSLMPGFRFPHLAAAAALLVLSLVLLSVLTAYRVHHLPVVVGWPAVFVQGWLPGLKP